MMRYDGEYKGTIVDIADPKNMGRAKVNVKGLFDEIPAANLPWAMPKDHSPSVKGGSTDILAKGQKVWVRFLEGDINFPVFHGGVIESAADLPKNASAKRAVIYESPNKRITITVNEETEDIEIKTKNYNTTLGTLIDLFLSHTQMTPAGVSGTPATGFPPITDLNFKTGTLK